MDIPDHSELDVTSYEMMWAGSEPTEAEKAREEADARQEYKGMDAGAIYKKIQGDV
jgi:hypothetical protein